MNKIMRLQGKKITVAAIAEVVPILLAKLEELESGANMMCMHTNTRVLFTFE